MGALEEDLHPLRASSSMMVTMAGCKGALRCVKEDVNAKAEENGNAKENAVGNGRITRRGVRMRRVTRAQSTTTSVFTADARAGCSRGEGTWRGWRADRDGNRYTVGRTGTL